MRRFIIFSIALFVAPMLMFSQESEFRADNNLLFKQEEYYRSASYDMGDLKALILYQRAGGKDFLKTFGMEFDTAGNGYTKIDKGHIFDFTVEGTQMEFPDITYRVAFECTDGRMTITLCRVWPGYFRYSKVSPWVLSSYNLFGGEDVLRARRSGSRYIRWQLELIRYMDAFFSDRADRMRDFIMSHPSEWEKPQIEMREVH